MDKRLKILLIILGVVIVFGLTFFIDTSNSGNNKENTEDPDKIIEQAQIDSEKAQESEMKDFNEINVSDYISYLEGDENKMVLVARPTCSYCQIAEPILKNISSEYNIVIDYLNTDEFSEEDSSTFITSVDEFKEGFGTPMLLVISNNKIVDIIDGLTTKSKYVKFMKKYKFI